MFTKGLLKVVYIQKRLALEMLNYKPGDYLRTITEYQELFKTSRGSVQIALKELQMAKIIKLHSKGVAGTQIVKLDYNKLLAILDITTIIGAMPIPYNLRQEGLATAFMQSFKDAEFRFACSYHQGSLNRIKGLLNNHYDFIILSKMASDYYKNIYGFKELLHLADESYGSRHVWVAKKGISSVKEGMRVGIDKTSFDQYFLVNKALPNVKLNFVDIHFPNVVNKLLDGTIDVAVWNVDMLDSFKPEEVNIIDNLEHVDDDRSAVVVAKSDRGDMAKIIKDYIKPLTIQKYQEKVMEGVIIPHF